MASLNVLVGEVVRIGLELSRKGFSWSHISLIGAMLHDSARDTVQWEHLLATTNIEQKDSVKVEVE